MAPECLIVEDAQVQLACIPETSGERWLEGYRLPLDRIEDRASESPEIHAAHHRHLVMGAAPRAQPPGLADLRPGARAAPASKSSRRTPARADGDAAATPENDAPQVNVSFPDEARRRFPALPVA